MKTIKFLLIAVLVIAGYSASAQFTDYGTFSNTLDRIGLGITADSSLYRLAVNGNSVYNGQLHIYGKIKAKSTDGLFVFGFGGDQGANAEFYSSTHATRPGELRFVYGNNGFGAANFYHYNGGSTWTSTMIMKHDGNVGIGTETPTKKLSVNGNFECDSIWANGKIKCKEVEVTLTGVWPDYVFGKEYDLIPLSEVEQFIKENKHLPGIPSSKEIEENGLSLGEMNKQLMSKVEELTLYLIQLQKEVNDLKSQK